MPSLPVLPVCSGTCPQTITAHSCTLGRVCPRLGVTMSLAGPSLVPRWQPNMFQSGFYKMVKIQHRRAALTAPSALSLWESPTDEPTHLLQVDLAEAVSQETFPLPVWALLNLFHVSSVCHNLLAVSQQGLCSQLTGTAMLPATLPGQNVFVEHSSGQVQQGWLACAHPLLLDFSLKAHWLIFCCYFQRRLNMP